MRTLNGAVIHRLVGACALMLVAALAPASWGATIIVPDHFPTIQMAIDASSEGDEIMVRAGTYAENLTVPSGLTIRSTDPDDPAVVMQTIIDGSNSGRVISANFDDLPLVINGFVIANGNVGGLSSGGGLWVGVDGTIVKNCTFIGNDAASGGALGGSSNFTAVNCTFVGNSAISGGAVDLNAGCVLENCTFNGNSATDDGGAVWEPAGGGTSGATVINCRFFGNTAGHDGGGAWNNTESTWTNCTFGDNLAGNAGGGFYSQFIHVPTIANSGFCRNTPDAIAGPYNSGGGNSLDYCAPAIPLRGACCINDECVVTAEDDCTDAGGTYQGDFTDCTDETCEDACPADVNGDGQVNFADVIALIGAWGACP